MTVALPILAPTPFAHRLGGELRAADRLTTLQINVGLVCNLACRHCHVESGPKRVEEHLNMSAGTADRILAWLADNPGIDKGRHHRRQPGDESELQAPRPWGTRARPRRHGSLQPDDHQLRRPLHRRLLRLDSGLPRRQPGRSGGLPPLLPAGQRRAAARTRLLRHFGRGPPASQRRRLRQSPRTTTQSGVQPRRSVPAAAAGGVGRRLPARAARALRHCLQRALDDHQHADQALPSGPRAPGAARTPTWICWPGPSIRRRSRA